MNGGYGTQRDGTAATEDCEDEVDDGCDGDVGRDGGGDEGPG